MEPTLRVGLPVYESVTARTLGALLSLAQSNVGPFTIVRGTWIDKARNELMESFKEDFLLMIDSDMEFDMRDVKKLVLTLHDNPEFGALSAHYLSRDGKGFPVCDWHSKKKPGMWLPDPERYRRAQTFMKAGEPKYVDSFGGGFLAITQEAKQKVGHPWFKTRYQDNGDYEGEDTFFCRRLQEEGFRPAVHFGVTVGHCGQAVYRPSKGKE